MKNPDLTEAKAVLAQIKVLKPDDDRNVAWLKRNLNLILLGTNVHKLRFELNTLLMENRCAEFTAPDEYLHFLEVELGLAKEQWKDYFWMMFRAREEPDKGGIGQNLAYIVLTIRSQLGLNWPKFIDFVEKKHVPIPWVKLLRSAQGLEDFKILFENLNLLTHQYRSSGYLNNNGFSGLLSAVKKDPRFNGSWKHFVAVLDAHLPFNGFTSPQEAQQCLYQEILRLRTSGTWIQEPTADNQITPAEWGAIAQEVWYKKNPVVRAVTDYLHSQQQES